MKITHILMCLLMVVPWAANATSPLGSYNVDTKGITISGISSGAFMAVQMQVAYSSTFSGVGSIAGGIYWCAEGDQNRAQTTCMVMPAQINSADQIAEAKTLAAQGAIDPLSNLLNQPVYIYASPSDSVVNPVSSDKLQEFYTALATPSLIKTEHSIKSAHGQPTLSSGNACQFGMLPWILNCGFDAAGELLQTLYGTLNPRGTFIASHLLQFSQANFGNAQTPLYANGWVYVPAACAGGQQCKLHVALHGCQMSPDFIQDQYVRLAGYNEWAETNNMIVIYPQSTKLGVANPDACWDWYGFTGQNYATKSGAQMIAIKNMIDQVTGAATVRTAARK